MKEMEVHVLFNSSKHNLELSEEQLNELSKLLSKKSSINEAKPSPIFEVDQGALWSNGAVVTMSTQSDIEKLIDQIAEITQSTLSADLYNLSTNKGVVLKYSNISKKSREEYGS